MPTAKRARGVDAVEQSEVQAAKRTNLNAKSPKTLTPSNSDTNKIAQSSGKPKLNVNETSSSPVAAKAKGRARKSAAKAKAGASSSASASAKVSASKEEEDKGKDGDNELQVDSEEDEKYLVKLLEESNEFVEKNQEFIEKSKEKLSKKEGKEQLLGGAEEESKEQLLKKTDSEEAKEQLPDIATEKQDSDPGKESKNGRDGLAKSKATKRKSDLKGNLKAAATGAATGAKAKQVRNSKPKQAGNESDDCDSEDEAAHAKKGRDIVDQAPKAKQSPCTNKEYEALIEKCREIGKEMDKKPKGDDTEGILALWKKN